MIEIGKFIESSNEDDLTKKQMWYFVSTYSILSYHECLNLNLTNKRKMNENDYESKRKLPK